jgi:DNA-binding GntR family transcriptional regulator
MAQTISRAAGSPYELLREGILEGRYAPGERLIEQSIAEELDVSRTPVREALRRLQAEGLVESYPNRGAVVRAFTPQHLIDTYGLRAVLEGYAAHQAARFITPADLERLEEHCRALEAATERDFESRREEVEYLVHHNGIFHQTIITASRNERVPDLIRQVSDLPLYYRSFYWYTPQERAVSNFFHRRILDALQAGDAERAGTLMREHVHFGRDVHLEHITRNEEAGASEAEPVQHIRATSARTPEPDEAR